MSLRKICRPRYYQSCDVYCAPSNRGRSFGIVLLKGNGGRARCFTNRISGYSSVLTHGREAFWPGQPASIAAGIAAC